jgi:hypothetical protein
MYEFHPRSRSLLECRGDGEFVGRAGYVSALIFRRFTEVNQGINIPRSPKPTGLNAATLRSHTWHSEVEGKFMNLSNHSDTQRCTRISGRLSSLLVSALCVSAGTASVDRCETSDAVACDVYHGIRHRSYASDVAAASQHRTCQNAGLAARLWSERELGFRWQEILPDQASPNTTHA